MPRASPISLALALALVPACVVVSTDGSERIDGQYVSATTLEQIKPGSTPEYVLSLLSEPTTKTALSDGTEIWKWSYSKSTSSKSSLLLLIDAEKCSSNRYNAYVQFENGVVAKTWRD
jgi:outer membrane protein assembly factor BamE (lipoprotein component of BamABCDE complex)